MFKLHNTLSGQFDQISPPPFCETSRNHCQGGYSQALLTIDVTGPEQGSAMNFGLEEEGEAGWVLS